MFGSGFNLPCRLSIFPFPLALEGFSTSVPTFLSPSLFFTFHPPTMVDAPSTSDPIESKVDVLIIGAGQLSSH